MILLYVSKVSDSIGSDKVSSVFILSKNGASTSS